MAKIAVEFGSLIESYGTPYTNEKAPVGPTHPHVFGAYPTSVAASAVVKASEPSTPNFPIRFMVANA